MTVLKVGWAKIVALTPAQITVQDTVPASRANVFVIMATQVMLVLEICAKTHAPTMECAI